MTSFHIQQDTLAGITRGDVMPIKNQWNAVGRVNEDAGTEVRWDVLLTFGVDHPTLIQP